MSSIITTTPYEPSFNITRAGKDYHSLGLTKTDGNRGANLAVTNWGDIIIYGIKKENEILWSLDHNHKDVFFKKDKVEGKKDKVEDEKKPSKNHNSIKNQPMFQEPPPKGSVSGC